MAAFVALALPAAASAFQTVTIEGSTLHIVGDKGKTADLVTIRYDSVKDEYVIGHDIDMPSPPPGCVFEGSGPPYKILHCPAKGIAHIKIETGSDKDKVSLGGMGLLGGLGPAGAPALWIPPDLVDVSISTGAGNDSVAGPNVPLARAGWASLSAAGNPVVQNIDMGEGTDVADVGDGINTVTFGEAGKFTGGNGTNTVTFGNGNSNVTAGGGTNNITLGNGNSKVTVGSGTNTATFGKGSSKFTGGDGTDKATFGAGNSKFTGNGGNDKARFGKGDNQFFGGAGNDVARLGPGNDKGVGGPGKDRLFGGPGIDTLIGGGGFDVLIGGAGRADKCFVGGGGGKTVGCEHG